MCSLVDAYLENAIEPLASATEPLPWHIGIREVVDWATSAMTPKACVGEEVGARADIFGTCYYWFHAADGKHVNYR
jgi:hypothetical protein